MSSKNTKKNQDGFYETKLDGVVVNYPMFCGPISIMPRRVFMGKGMKSLDRKLKQLGKAADVGIGLGRDDTWFIQQHG